MKKKTRYIGIDVYLKKYYISILDKNNKEIIHFSGSVDYNRSLNKLFKQIRSDDKIIICESDLAALLIVKFENNEIYILENKILDSFKVASISRGFQIAKISAKYLRINKVEKTITKSMENKILNYFDLKIKNLEKLSSQIDNIQKKENSISNSEIKKIEELGNSINFDTPNSSYFEKIISKINNFDKANENFNES